MKKHLFDRVSTMCSSMTTRAYSTSFSMGILLFDKPIRKEIYAIYGFVRFADEIVDSFHGYKQEELLEEFKSDTYKSIKNGISLNPILNSFQNTVNKYQINHDLIEQFLVSMEMDLKQKTHDQDSFESYVLGSAEVVGLMCLSVFCDGDATKYNALKESAMKLGAAFQKVNFLRDLNEDVSDLGRTYFPSLNMQNFDQSTKTEIEKDIEDDFKKGYLGILKLPKSSRLGVYLAYVYYNALFNKIKKIEPKKVLAARVRIPNQRKYSMLIGSYIKYNLNII